MSIEQPVKFPLCEICKTNEFTLIIDGVKMCIQCFDMQLTSGKIKREEKK